MRRKSKSEGMSFDSGELTQLIQDLVDCFGLKIEPGGIRARQNFRNLTAAFATYPGVVLGYLPKTALPALLQIIDDMSELMAMAGGGDARAKLKLQAIQRILESDELEVETTTLKKLAKLKLEGKQIQKRAHAFFIYFVIEQLESVVRPKAKKRYGQHLVEVAPGQKAFAFFGIEHNESVVLRDDNSFDNAALAKFAEANMLKGKMNTLQRMAERIYAKQAQQKSIKPIPVATLEPLVREFLKVRHVSEAGIFFSYLLREGLFPLDPLITIESEPT